MTLQLPTFDDITAAQAVLKQHFSPAPLIRSYAMEKALGLAPGRQVWLKDYGWTPVGSFKLMGALNWMHCNLDRIGDCPVTAHSSGNFASGLSFAGYRYGKRVIIVMPENAPQIKFERTKQFGATIRTYDISTDHLTGYRDKLTAEIAEQESAIQASPYDDRFVIAGNGVGGCEIAQSLRHRGRELSRFICAVSGGGLMAGHALAIKHEFPESKVIGVEPANADDFCQSMAAGKRVRIEHPTSICDGLLSYDVGEHNWPILHANVDDALSVTDEQVCAAMRWYDCHHGLRTEPSGAITAAAALTGAIDLGDSGDIVIVISGRNVDASQFREWTTIGK